MHVTPLSVAPVRSLGLQHPESIYLTKAGVPEDRRFYLIDERGRLIDRLVVGRLVQVESRTDPGAGVLWMRFPDGTIVEDEVRLGRSMQTAIYGRTATGHVVMGPWGDALESMAGRRVEIVRTDRPGGTRVAHPCALITRGSVRRLAQELGIASLDARRFRMLVELDGDAPNEEDTWVGSCVLVANVVLEISGPVARCAITTQDPVSGEHDLDTLRAIISYRGLRDGKNADFGVFGEVVREGTIHVGDALTLLNRVETDHLAVGSQRARVGELIGGSPTGHGGSNQ